MEDSSKEIPTDVELHEVIKMNLKKSPTWKSLISTVETEVIKLFESKGIINIPDNKPEQPEIVELINKLISEYMNRMGYKLTCSMFAKESGTEFKKEKDRKQITSLLDLEDSHETLNLPLLTVLISMFKNKNGDKENLGD